MAIPVPSFTPVDSFWHPDLSSAEERLSALEQATTDREDGLRLRQFPPFEPQSLYDCVSGRQACPACGVRGAGWALEFSDGQIGSHNLSDFCVSGTCACGSRFSNGTDKSAILG